MPAAASTTVSVCQQHDQTLCGVKMLMLIISDSASDRIHKLEK